MTIHHATVKKAEKAGIALKEVDYNGETWIEATSGKDSIVTHTDAKIALEAATIQKTLAAEYPTVKLAFNESNWEVQVELENAVTDIMNPEELPDLAAILDAVVAADFDPEEGADEEADEKSNGVPQKYKQKYLLNEDPDSCSDEVAHAFKEAVTGLNEKGKPAVDLEKLSQVAEDNGLLERYEGYVAKGMNNGMKRMNIGNVIRAMVKRGEAVTIGNKTWEAK